MPGGARENLLKGVNRFWILYFRLKGPQALGGAVEPESELGPVRPPGPVSLRARGDFVYARRAYRLLAMCCKGSEASQDLGEKGMQTWIVILAAAFGALVVDVAWLWPALAAAPLSDLPSSLLSHLPTLGLSALLIFAFIALVLTIVTMVIDSNRVRLRLAGFPSPNLQEWQEAFAASALSGLEARLLDLTPQDRWLESASLVLSGRFDPGLARREIGRQFSRHLVRAQFFTALALSLAIAAIVWIGKLGYLPPLSAAIPAVAAAIAAVVLLLFAVIGRGIVTMAAEPLLDAISAFPFERLESELLRRIIGLSQAGVGSRPSLAPPVGMGIEPQLAQVVEAIEEERRLLLAAIEEERRLLIGGVTKLAEQAEALALAARYLAERPAEGGASALPSGDSEALRAAIERLGERVGHLAATQALLASGEGAAPPVNVPPADSSGLGQELRRLIAELE